MRPVFGGRHAVACAAFVLAGCAGESTNPVAPLSLTAAPSSPVAQVSAPGADVAAAPAVIVQNPDGTPAPNVYVSFSVSRGGGLVSRIVVKSDAQGLAASGAWKLGDTGENEVVAALEGGASMAFEAYAIDMPATGEAYDLVSTDGRPVGAVGSGQNSSVVIAGRLALGADSNYSAVTVQYSPATHHFTVVSYHGAYSVSGTQLTLADYAGPSAQGVIQAGGLVVRSGNVDVAMQEDVYVKLAGPR